MKNQLKAGAILSYLALFINSFISIIYTPIMLKYLGQSEYGLYSLASATAGYVGVLNFGLGNALIRYSAKYKALKDEKNCYNLYGLFFKMYLILGLIAFVSGIVMALNIEALFSSSLNSNQLGDLKILIGIMTINISVGIGLGMFSVIILAHEKFIIQKLISILSSIMVPAIMLPLLLMNYGSITMVVVTTIINFVAIIINMYYCFFKLNIKINFDRVDNSLLKEIIIFSFYIFLNIVISQIYWSTDQVILGIYSGTVAVSIYSIAASFTGYFSGFSAAISNVFLSKVSRMVTLKVSDNELSELFIRVGRVQYLVISYALSGFIVFGQEFIILWVGNDYKQSYIVALIILVPMLVSLIQGMGGVILQAKNKQKFKSIINFIVALLNVVMSVIFVQLWGILGCAVATAISFLMGNIIIINVYYWRSIGIDIPKFWVNIIIMSLPLTISIIYGLYINEFVIADSWTLLLIKILVFSIGYNVITWLISMNKYEKELILNPIKKINNSLKQKRFIYYKS